MHCNRVVSAGTLIDELWEGNPPSSAVTTLQTYVYQLRRTLGPDILRTRAGGYVLEVERARVDTLRFEDALTRAADAHGLVAERANVLRDALALWHGRRCPSSRTSRGPGSRQHAWRRCDSRRSKSLSTRGLALGEHAGGSRAGVARGCASASERLWTQRMLALYRSGRQADALRAATRLREHLRDELGLEPSSSVIDLEHAILDHDPALDLAAPFSRPAPVPPPPSTPHGRRRARTAVLVALVLALVGIIGTVLAVQARRSSSSKRRFAAPHGYEPATSMVPVLARWRRWIRRRTAGSSRCPRTVVSRGGRTIKLGVFRFPSLARQPVGDPVVQVVGEFHYTVAPSDSSLRSRSDSIWLSGSGFFGSTPRLTCPAVSAAVTASLTRPAQ